MAGLLDNTNNDYAEVVKVLLGNADKNFVQRIIQPQSFPVMRLPDGNVATHQMEWTEKDGKYFVYPRILFEGGKLKDYGDKAFDVAAKRGDVIEFASPEKADWFSKNYKIVWK